MKWRLVVACLLAWPGGCAERGDDAGTSSLAPAQVRPDDFAIRGCARTGDAPCAIVQAGGKTLLFGAPEGAYAALTSVGVAVPDGVFLMRLDGASIEGLIAVRNRSWQAGREAPLALAGPQGTADLVAGVERGLTRSDAIAYLEHRPAGGYDTAPLRAIEVSPAVPARVFDTGDLRVEAVPSGPERLTYIVWYRQTELQIAPCGTGAPAMSARKLTCQGEGSDLVWPLNEFPVFLNR